MGLEVLPVVIISVIWAIFAFGIPAKFALTPNYPNKGVIITVSSITGFSCWLFWILCYLHQMNPLIGPALHNTTLIALMYIWDGTYVVGNTTQGVETH